MTRWETWTERVQGPIYDGLMAMQVARQNFEILDQMGQVGGIPGSARWFVNWVRRGHYHIVATGLRRQAEVRSDVVSLARLLDEIARHPLDFSLESYLNAATGDTTDLQAREANIRSVALPGVDVLNPGIPARDLDLLRSATGAARRFVNKRTAHLSTSGSQPNLRYAELL